MSWFNGLVEIFLFEYGAPYEHGIHAVDAVIEDIK